MISIVIHSTNSARSGLDGSDRILHVQRKAGYFAAEVEAGRPLPGVWDVPTLSGNVEIIFLERERTREHYGCEGKR